MNSLFNRSRAVAGGILTKLLVGLVILGLTLAVLWIFFLPVLVTRQIEAKTGFAVVVEKLSVNPFTGNADVRGLVVKNPAGWPVTEFVELQEFRAQIEIKSAFSERIIADEVILSVARCTLVKNSQGLINGKVFSDALTRGSADTGSKPNSPAKKFLIKHLVLKFDTLVYADYSTPKPAVKEYALKLNRDLKDVDSVAKILNPIASASIGSLGDIFGGLLQGGRGDLLKDAAGAIKDAGKKTGEKLKGLLDSLDKKQP